MQLLTTFLLTFVVTLLVLWIGYSLLKLSKQGILAVVAVIGYLILSGLVLLAAGIFFVLLFSQE